MECHHCKKDFPSLEYDISYPRLITKREEWNGAVPSGDILIRVCAECKKMKGVVFHGPNRGTWGKINIQED